MNATLGWFPAILAALVSAGSAAAATTTIPIDQVGNVGRKSAIAIGADGFPVVSYLQGQPGTPPGNLRFTKCGSVDCITGNSSVTLATGGVVANLSLVVPSDGRPVLAYLQDVGGTLVARVTRCGNPQCSIGNTTQTLPGTPYDSSYDWGPPSDGIVLGPDDRPVVAFAQPGSVRIVKCTDAGCTSTSSVVMPLANVSSAKIAVGPDGKPVIVALNPEVQLAKCATSDCTTAPAFVELTDTGAYYFGAPTTDFALAVGPDDLPVLTLNAGGNGLRVLRCHRPDCGDGAQFITLTRSGGTAAFAIGGDGRPVIAIPWNSVEVLKCGDPTCASNSRISTVDEDRGNEVSIAIGSDDRPVIAYFDALNEDLFVARCGDESCQASGGGGQVIGQSGDPVAFVTAFERRRVLLYAGDTLITEIVVGDGPLGVAFSRDGKKAYVTNLSSGTISFIDVKTRVVERTVSLGAASQPRGIAVAPDHSRLYVAKSGTNEVAVVDRATGTVITSVPVGGQPFGLSISPDGGTVVTANTTGNSASFVSTATNTLLGTVPAGQSPYGVVISPDGTVAYMATFGSNAVAILSMETRSVVGTIAVGLGPFGVAVKGDGTRLYVSDNQNRVSVVDTASRTVIDSIPVGSHPQGVALSPDEAHLFVANQFSDNVSVISTSNLDLISTLPAPGAPVSLGAFVSPPLIDAVQAVEYFHQNFGHYFVTSIPAEIQALDTAGFVGWARTGETFNVFALGSGQFDVCRFFTVAFPPKSSHFYTPLANECAIVKTNPDWTYEGVVFEVSSPWGGTCPVGTTPLYRLYNNGQGGAPNHRYTTKASIRDQMVAQGFVFEGATGCVPK